MGCKILRMLPAEIGGDEEWDEDKTKGLISSGTTW